jgi:type IX secretion system PorP/SprF family membrane protein
MRKLIFILFILISTQKISAQYFQFSQYNYTDQRVSPAAPASNDYARLGMIYRNQTTGGGLRLNTSMLSASYPLINKSNGRRWSGIGVTLLDDRSGGLYKVSEGAVSYAANVFLSERQSLSLGVKGLYQQRKIETTDLFTGSQYIPDRGFDPSMNNGENFSTMRMSMFTLSTGLSWQNVDANGIRNAYGSLSLFDLNRPKDAFVNTHHLNSTIVVAGGFRLYKNSNLSILPEMLYTRNASINVFNVGWITRCNVRATRDMKAFYVDLISKYVINRSVILGLQFQGENFSIGFTYDLPNKNNVGNLGAFEIGLELRNLIAPVKPIKQKKITVVDKQKPVKKVVNKIDSVQQKPVGENNLALSLQAKRDSVRAISVNDNEPLVLDKVLLYFNFKFNSSELDEASKNYLDELANALKQDVRFNVKLTGHTDNVGSAKSNLKLSRQRAEAIADYLISKDIDANRIVTDGKGMSQPLNDNKTEDERTKNRRVELVILYKE